MDARRAALDIDLVPPGSSKVVYQPLGVVGIIAPWNYPLYLAAGPLVAALAAGNRAMLKLSEFTPRTAELFDGLLRKAFADDEVVVVHGDATAAAEFSRLPLDHTCYSPVRPRWDATSCTPRRKT